MHEDETTRRKNQKETPRCPLEIPRIERKNTRELRNRWTRSLPRGNAKASPIKYVVELREAPKQMDQVGTTRQCESISNQVCRGTWRNCQTDPPGRHHVTLRKHFQSSMLWNVGELRDRWTRSPPGSNAKAFLIKYVVEHGEATRQMDQVATTWQSENVSNQVCRGTGRNCQTDGPGRHHVARRNRFQN